MAIPEHDRTVRAAYSHCQIIERSWLVLGYEDGTDELREIIKECQQPHGHTGRCDFEPEGGPPAYTFSWKGEERHL